MVVRLWGSEMPRKFIASYTSRIVRDLVCGELLQSQAITFHLDKPKTLRDGIESPIYIDKYKTLSHPENWRDVVDATICAIDADAFPLDFVAAVASSSAMLSQAVAYRMGLPALVVSEQDWTMQEKDVSNLVKGKKVVLIEDSILTGKSVLQAVNRLREAGAIVSDIVTLTSYELPEMKKSMLDANLVLHQVITLSEIVNRAYETKILTQDEQARVLHWIAREQ